MNVKGKVAIVTGTSSGIGFATAELLTKKGAMVMLVARSGKKLDGISKSLPGSDFFVADLSDPSQIKSAVKNTLKKFGRIDILINNAGRGYDATVEKH